MTIMLWFTGKAFRYGCPSRCGSCSIVIALEPISDKASAGRRFMLLFRRSGRRFDPRTARSCNSPRRNVSYNACQEAPAAWRMVRFRGGQQELAPAPPLPLAVASLLGRGGATGQPGAGEAYTGNPAKRRAAPVPSGPPSASPLSPPAAAPPGWTAGHASGRSRSRAGHPAAGAFVRRVVPGHPRFALAHALQSLRPGRRWVTALRPPYPPA